MAKKSPAKRIAHLEEIVLGAGFLLQRLHARHGHDFGVGTDEQVRHCIRDCAEVGRVRAQRTAAAEAASASSAGGG